MLKWSSTSEAFLDFSENEEITFYMKRGTIENYKLFQLFKGLYNQKLSGWLVLTHPQGQRQLYLDQGFPSFLRSGFAHDHILWALVQEGMCSSTEANQLEQLQLGFEDLYAYLVHQQMVSQGRLDQILVDLISKGIWESLAWEEGSFEWIHTASPPPILTPVDPLYVLALGGVESLSISRRMSLLDSVTHAHWVWSNQLASEEYESLVDLCSSELVHGLKQEIDGNHLLELTQADEELQGVLCGLVVCGLISAVPGSQSSSTSSTPSSQNQLRPVRPSANQGRPVSHQTDPILSPGVQSASRTQSQSPSQPQPQSQQSSRSQTPQTPQSFIDPKAKVNPSSKPSSSTTVHSSPASSPTRSKDRRVMRPPQNWRQFSIGKQNASSQPSSLGGSSPSPRSPTPSSSPLVDPNRLNQSAVPTTPSTPPSTSSSTPPSTSSSTPSAEDFKNLEHLLFGDLDQDLAEDTSSTDPAPPLSPPLPTDPAPPISPPSPPPIDLIAPPVSSPAHLSSLDPQSHSISPPPKPSAPSATALRQQRNKKNEKQSAKKTTKKPAPAKIQRQIDLALELYAKREELNYYQLFDLTTSASIEHIKKAFKKQAGLLHIDRFMRFDLQEETLDVLKKTFILLNQAHQVLTSPDQKQEYDLSLNESNQEINQPTSIADLLKAEKWVRDALNCVKLSRFEHALELIEQAKAITPEDGLLQAVEIYANALLSKQKGATDVVVRQYAESLETLTYQYDSREEPYLYLGRLYALVGLTQKAETALIKALEINPHLAEAKSELRHLQRQPSTSSSKGSLFQRLKKK